MDAPSSRWHSFSDGNECGSEQTENEGAKSDRAQELKSCFDLDGGGVLLGRCLKLPVTLTSRTTTAGAMPRRFSNPQWKSYRTQMPHDLTPLEPGFVLHLIFLPCDPLTVPSRPHPRDKKTFRMKLCQQSQSSAMSQQQSRASRKLVGCSWRISASPKLADSTSLVATTGRNETFYPRLLTQNLVEEKPKCDKGSLVLIQHDFLSPERSTAQCIDAVVVGLPVM
ncbi:hypothetical protein BKA80DRAFT_258970 [Phyllosticta citrichinensis]